MKSAVKCLQFLKRTQTPAGTTFKRGVPKLPARDYFVGGYAALFYSTWRPTTEKGVLGASNRPFNVVDVGAGSLSSSTALGSVLAKVDDRLDYAFYVEQTTGEGAKPRLRLLRCRSERAAAGSTRGGVTELGAENVLPAGVAPETLEAAEWLHQATVVRVLNDAETDVLGYDETVVTFETGVGRDPFGVPSPEATGLHLRPPRLGANAYFGFDPQLTPARESDLTRWLLL